MRNIKLYIIVLILIFNNGCGFTVLDRSKLSNFDVLEISSSGEKSIGYKLKNKILSESAKENPKKINIDLKINKNKSIKEKNIKNEIVKYQIDLNVDVVLTEIIDNRIKNFTLKVNGDYNVGSQHSNTLSNEKILVKNLTDNLSDDLLENIIIIINDL